MQLERGATLTIVQQNEAVRFCVVDVFTYDDGHRYAAIMRLDALPAPAEVVSIHFLKVLEGNDDIEMSIVHDKSLRRQLLGRYRHRLLQGLV